jgi:hypothetical protein
MKKLIYLDHAATTPMDARVLEAMRPYFADDFGNPSSFHTIGMHAKDAVAEARGHFRFFVPGAGVFQPRLGARGVVHGGVQLGRGEQGIAGSPSVFIQNGPASAQSNVHRQVQRSGGGL